MNTNASIHVSTLRDDNTPEACQQARQRLAEIIGLSGFILRDTECQQDVLRLLHAREHAPGPLQNFHLFNAFGSLSNLLINFETLAIAHEKNAPEQEINRLCDSMDSTLADMVELFTLAADEYADGSTADAG